VLLYDAFTLWRSLEDESSGPSSDPAAATAASGRNGTGQDQRVRVVSFNSTFSMSFAYCDRALPGEGLAFLIVPSSAGPPPGSHDGFLGLTNATFEASPARNQFVAVEFDMVKQSYDPSDNHVGLDIGTVVSNKTANLADFNITIATDDMVSATNYTVWIEYDGVGRSISVYMVVQGKPKPATPVLAAPLDLSQHVPEHAYIGFSGSTGAAYELNCILDWTLWIETIPEDEVKKWWIVLVAVVGSVGVAGIAIAAFFLARISRARRAVEQRQARLGHTLSHLPGMPREFTYESLRKATNSFHEQLGEGAYGVVYKGTLPAEADDGRAEAMQVAVKKFMRDDARCVEDFVKEVDIINRLRHKNIVPLIGMFESLIA
jgi:hypothetical protein